MTNDVINLDDYNAPEKPDFRRVGKGIPFVIHPESGKRVRYSRSSNAGKILDDESNLTDWKLRTVVAGAAQRPELMAQASVLDIDTDKKALRDIAEECLIAGKGQRRAIIGTAVHAMFDLIDRDTGWVPPPNFIDLCNAYVAFKEEWGLIPAEIEVHCINDVFRLAGTLDRRYRTTKTLVCPDGTIVPIGTLIVGDIKTGQELEYAAGSYGTQLAAYVDSVRYDVATDEREPFVPSSFTQWALIVHAESSGTRIDVYWVDIAAGRQGLELASEVKQWRRRDDLLILGHQIPFLADTAKPEPPPPADGPALAAVGPSEGRSLGLRHEYLAGRVRAILGDHEPNAARDLQRAWPVGIPGLKHEGHTWADLDAIEEAVKRVEDKYWIVPPDDPTIIKEVEEAKQRHPSNEPKPRATKEERENVQAAIDQHPRSGLLRKWIAVALSEGVDYSLDTVPLSKALMSFANVDEDDWHDNDLTLMLDGSLRALGYAKGIADLGRFNPEHAQGLMTAAFAIVSGSAMLLFDEDNNPIVRTHIRKVEE